MKPTNLNKLKASNNMTKTPPKNNKNIINNNLKFNK